MLLFASVFNAMLMRLHIMAPDVAVAEGARRLADMVGCSSGCGD